MIDDLTLHPPQRTLRQFGAATGVLLSGTSVWMTVVRHRPGVAGVAAVLAVIAALVTWVRPALLRYPYVGLMVVTFPINWLVSSAVLAILFYGVITPLALWFRLRGRDVLNRRKPVGGSHESYWSARVQVNDLRSYLRQF